MPPEGAGSIIGELFNWGALGIALAATLWFAWRQHKDLAELNRARTDDAKAVVERVLTLAKSQNETTIQLADELSKLRSCIEATHPRGSHRDST